MLQLFNFVNVEDFGVLSFVGMARTVVDVEVLDELTSETVFGKHAFHNAKEKRVHACFEVLVVRFLDEHFGCELALTAGIACVVEVDLVGEFFTGKNDFVSVNDDDVVAALYERSVSGFVFAAQDFCDFRAKTTEVLVGSIDDHPFAINLLSVW